jgi:hypothetical protein
LRTRAIGRRAGGEGEAEESLSFRARLERLEVDQPEPVDGMPSPNFFDLLPAVYVLGTVDMADLSPVDRAWAEKFRGVFVTEDVQDRECGPAGL